MGRKKEIRNEKIVIVIDRVWLLQERRIAGRAGADLVGRGVGGGEWLGLLDPLVRAYRRRCVPSGFYPNDQNCSGRSECADLSKRQISVPIL